MPQILKPSNLSLTWASNGDILNPGDTKYATGWLPEIPPRQWFNYLDNRQDEAIAHINQHGIAVWDAATEYQYELTGEKSVVMGSDGIIYRTLTTNTNQDPTTAVGVHWEIAFADSGAFYTKTESDGLYLAKAQNLADLTNAATARTNLSVYSQAQTYTKTEVDAKTTVASTAQAQAQTSDTVLISALKLANAFKGSNQSLIAAGFQKFPGDLIVQWAGVTASNSASSTFTYSVPISTFLFGGVQINSSSNTASTSIITPAGSALTSYQFITTSAVAQNHLCFVVGKV